MADHNQPPEQAGQAEGRKEEKETKETLFLTSTDMLERCRSRWQKSVLTYEGRIARHLAIIQNPAWYCACLAFKRSGNIFSEDEKKKLSAGAGKNYVVEAWLKRLIDKL